MGTDNPNSLKEYPNQVQLINDEKTDNTDIYCLLLRDFLNKGNKGIVLIDDQTSAFSKIGSSIGETLKFVEENIKSNNLSDKTIQNFKESNKVSQKLSNLTECNEKCILITHQDIIKIFNENDGWEVLRKKYSPFKSIITFSTIAFDDQHMQALVYIGYQNGEKSGAGYYYFLVKEKQTWVIKEKVNVWES